jgi:hypothetical protein
MPPPAELIPTLRSNDLCSAAFFGDLARVKELLTVEEVEEDPPLEPDENFDPLAPADDELEAENAERQKLRDANEAEILKKLSEPGVVTSRRTPVDKTVCGLGLEVLPVAGGGSVRSVFVPRADCAQNKATPLHFAVLAREHEIVAFLISQGADPHARDPTFAVSPLDICKTNRLHETARVVGVASELLTDKKSEAQSAKDARAATLQRRAEARGDAQRKLKEEEEAAEREAAGDGAAADDGAGGGGDDDYDDGNYADE